LSPCVRDVHGGATAAAAAAPLQPQPWWRTSGRFSNNHRGAVAVDFFGGQ